MYFWLWLRKKNRPIKTWANKVREFAGECKKLCRAEAMQIYPTLSETKAAFAERTLRNLKNNFYCYMKEYGYNYINKSSPFVTSLNSRKNCSIDLIPNVVKNPDILSLLYSKPLRDNEKPKFKMRDRVRISVYDLPFNEGFRPQFIQEVFETVAIFFQKTTNIHNKGWKGRDYPW